jgi:hypothetical protein
MRFQSVALPAAQIIAVEDHARDLLVDARALGVFPTPVRQIVETAGVSVEDTVAFDELVLTEIRDSVSGVPGKSKRVSDKIVGFLDCKERVAYVDSQAHKAKKPFVMLHETGHDQLPWQRELFAWMEESESTLDIAVKEQLEQEANAFASAVMYQCEVFAERASKLPFGIETPLALSKMFGGSVYSSIWRYVTRSELPCAVVVVDKAESVKGALQFPLRRAACSNSFSRQMGQLEWPDFIDTEHPVAPAIPTGKRKMIKDHAFVQRGTNGKARSCQCQSFTNGFQSFVLMRVT